MIDLANVLDFGGTDADEDELVSICFEDHEAYTSAKTHQRFLIIGRKGSGKTAIYKKLLEPETNCDFSSGVSFEGYPWHYHELMVEKNLPPDQRYIQAWKYLILIELAKIAVNKDYSINKSGSKEMNKIKKFIKDTYESLNPSRTDVFNPQGGFQKVAANFGIKLPPGGWGGELGVTLDNSGNRGQSISFAQINDNLLSCICKVLNKENNYHICFDQLDHDFDPENDEYKCRLIGLLRAAKSINKHAKDSLLKLSCVVFLRDDIYEVLQFEDKNKLTENRMSTIEWDRINSRHTLKSLMEKRIASRLGIEAEEELDCWNLVFGKQIMTKSQQKYNYILDRTFNRPRDMIKYCNEALKVCKERAANGSDIQIANDDLLRAEDVYSQYFYREVEDELPKNMPDYKRYFRILKSLNAVDFKLDEFEKLHSELISNSIPDSKKPIEVLENLFDFSVVGLTKRGG